MQHRSSSPIPPWIVAARLKSQILEDLKAAGEDAPDHFFDAPSLAVPALVKEEREAEEEKREEDSGSDLDADLDSDGAGNSEVVLDLNTDLDCLDARDADLDKSEDVTDVDSEDSDLENEAEDEAAAEFVILPPRPAGFSTKVYKAVYSGVPVYEMMHRGVQVMRRIADDYINATQILKVAGYPKSQRTKTLEMEVHKGPHDKVQGGYWMYQGTWVRMEDGVKLAKRHRVDHLIGSILDFAPDKGDLALTKKEFYSQGKEDNCKTAAGKQGPSRQAATGAEVAGSAAAAAKV
ncbi:transcription regulator HTH, apses-type DNA-binding domain-containing protein [Chytriomyces sp. MP71]|nr:transcription regulator HTH, apses-type DNA-binding domain-containing protein [Chytriomyces sp. MP71]